MSGQRDAALVKGMQSAHALHAAGKADAAIAAARRALSKHPEHADGAKMLAQMLMAQGRVEEARFALTRAMQANPNDASLIVVSGEVEAMGGDHTRAIALAEQAMSKSPGFARAHALRGWLFLASGRYTEAAADLRAASEALPKEPEHRSNLALALLATAHAPEACELLQTLVREQPTFLPARATLAQAMNYHPGASVQEVFEAHTSYGELCEKQNQPLTPSPEALGTDRPIRVGFLTRDLRRHSCAYFLLPILEHLDRSRFEPIAYMDSPIRDDLTERFVGLFGESNWNETSRLSNPALAAKIRADRVGVLLDLSGHFLGSRLSVMAMTPAPASATYLGYPNTTGLTCVSARFVDSVTDPEGGCEPLPDALATERLIRLEGGGGGVPLWCYRPDEGLPQPGAIDADRPFIFVSFNDLKKINDPLLDDWGEILKRVPSARLILKTGALGDYAVREETLGRLVSRGIAPERLELLGYVPSHAEHLAVYQRAHVALDTHPYCGTTTTLEAAWMGVPTLTLAPEEGGRPEPRHAARVGASLNAALGLGDYTTTSRARYVDRAVEIARSFGRDPGPLNAVRTGLRARFEASPLRDEAGFVRRFEAALAAVVATSGERPGGAGATPPPPGR